MARIARRALRIKECLRDGREGWSKQCSKLGLRKRVFLILGGGQEEAGEIQKSPGRKVKNDVWPKALSVLLLFFRSPAGP